MMTGPDLRTQREALHLSREKLARLVPCAGLDLYRWETGRVRITTWREPGIRKALKKAARAAEKNMKEKSE